MAPVDPGGGGGLPPNLPQPGDQVEVNREALRDIARTLQKDLDALNDGVQGSLRYMQSGDQARVPTADLGDYPAGQQIARTFESAYNSVTGVYQQFLGSYQQVINAIKQTADNYQAAEENTQASVNQVGTQTGQW